MVDQQAHKLNCCSNCGCAYGTSFSCPILLLQDYQARPCGSLPTCEELWQRASTAGPRIESTADLLDTAVGLAVTAVSLPFWVPTYFFAGTAMLLMFCARGSSYILAAMTRLAHHFRHTRINKRHVAQYMHNEDLHK